jgi:adenosylhomocysteine nucleosidase
MNRVIFVALEEELPMDMVPSGYNVVYTGIGKVNATYAVTRFITANPHVETVYNYGTAGASDDSVAGELLEVNALIERDMDLTPLGIPPYVTQEKQVPYIYTSNRDTEIICGTGDSFARPNPPDYHIVDMEAYAIASVVRRYGIGQFYCYKYISDTDSDEDPGEAWKKNVSKGAKKFINRLTK